MHAEAPEFFLRLSRDQVGERVGEPGRYGIGTRWQSLLRLMDRNGYERVSDIGPDAAAAWAFHLGLSSRARRR